MPAFIFKHEEESPIIKLMMNVMILKMVFREQEEQLEGLRGRMGAFTPGSPPSVPQPPRPHIQADPMQEDASHPPILSPCTLTATHWGPSRGTMSTGKVLNAKGTVLRNLTH